MKSTKREAGKLKAGSPVNSVVCPLILFFLGLLCALGGEALEPKRGARHHARSHFHREFDRRGQLRRAMLDRGLCVASLIAFHLIQYRVAFFVTRRQSVDMAGEVAFDLAFGLREKTQIPFVAE